MTAQELTLNIAVNLGRLARWASEGKLARIPQFMEETDQFVKQLEHVPKSERFQKTFEAFHNSFISLKANPRVDLVWAEQMLTWSNILTHRAKLA